MASKRGRLNLVLALALAGLAAGAWFSREVEQPGPPITPLAPDAIASIEVEHPDAALIRLEKRGAVWWLVAPVEMPADALEVGALAGLADREQKRAIDAGQASLEDLGLQDPKFTVRLNETAIEFGIVETLEYRRYVRVGDTVSLIEDPPSAALDADYADLAAKTVMPQGAKIQRIALPDVELSRDGDGPWSLSPADPEVSADQLQSLANGWTDARAMWNEHAGEDPPTGEAVAVTLADGTTLGFRVVAREPQLKLRRNGTAIVYVLSKALVDTMLRVPDPPSEPAAANGAGDEPATPTDSDDTDQ